MSLCPEVPPPGFSLANRKRNAILQSKGFTVPKPRKTGTTIAGIIFKDGVILGADTRATEDTTVSDKNCAKIHYLARNIYCCGAGIAADTEKTTQMVASELELHRFYTNRQPRVGTAHLMLKQYLFGHGGEIGAALILGGIDATGPHIYSIYPHGSSDQLPYTTMGSGCLASMGIFESRWEPDLEEEEGVQLVRDAIAAGIFNDLGSGSNVDVVIIRKEAVDYRRTHEEANKKGVHQRSYLYREGTTPVLNSKVIEIVDETVQPVESQPYLS